MRTRIISGSDAPTRQAGRNPVRAYDLRPNSDAPLVLGRYRLRRRLGTGGFATVWLAHDERLDRQVAVKILPRGRVIGGRFEREARATARLAHPGIVTLFEAAVDDEGAYLVSELVHGATLDELLEAGRLSDRDVLSIGIALCDALAHAHAHGVIHRDVKPSNVLVPERPTTPAQLARLTDFGVARITGPARPGDTLTRTGDVIGTEAYMAPEQAQGLPVSAPADVFALALVLYEALSGTNPLRGALGGRRGTHLPPLRRQRRELPRELGQAVDLALRPRPSERASLAELRAALALSLPGVSDEPGVVAAPWPARTLDRRAGPSEEDPFRQEPLRGQPFRQDPLREDPLREESFREPATRDRPSRERSTREHRRPVASSRRALAGLAAALLAVWVARHVPGMPSGPTALAACLAGLLTAVLPRAGWVILVTAAAAAMIIVSHPGGALVLLSGGVVPVLLGPFDGPAWPLAAAAPALGTLGLAAAWPAIAGLSRRPHRRAVLAATGYIWAALWSRDIGSAASLHDAVHQVLSPLAGTGTVVCAGVWAVAAVTLHSTRSRWPALECLRLILWAIGLALGTLVAGHLGGGAPIGSVWPGAGAGAFVALATSRSGARLRASRSGNDPPPLA